MFIGVSGHRVQHLVQAPRGGDGIVSARYVWPVQPGQGKSNQVQASPTVLRKKRSFIFSKSAAGASWRLEQMFYSSILPICHIAISMPVKFFKLALEIPLPRRIFT